MADLGLKAYRFSVAWPRLFPDGGGADQPRRARFYDRLVDGCWAGHQADGDALPLGPAAGAPGGHGGWATATRRRVSATTPRRSSTRWATG